MSDQPNPPNDFAVLLQLAMDARGESQERAAITMNQLMAEELGHQPNHIHVSTSQATISKWLAGDNGPNRKKFRMLAKYCQVSLGVIERLCGNPAQSDDVGVLRETLVDTMADNRRLVHKNIELGEALAEAHAKAAAAEKAHLRSSAATARRLAQAETTLAEARRELAQLRASTPVTPVGRGRHKVAAN